MCAQQIVNMQYTIMALMWHGRITGRRVVLHITVCPVRIIIIFKQICFVMQTKCASTGPAPVWD